MLITCCMVVGNLSFDQSEICWFYFTFCLSSSQLAHSWRDSFQDFSLFPVFCYLLHTTTQDSRAKIKHSLWYTHVTDFKMETIFKLNLKIKFAEILQHMQLLNTLTLDQSLTNRVKERSVL